MYQGKIIGEKLGTQVIKVDRLNKVKYFLDEGDGFEYEFNPEKQ